MSTTAREGKFSDQESKLIVDFILDYVKSHELTLPDVISQMRDEEGYEPPPHSHKRRSDMWKELAVLVPGRSIKVIRVDIL